jgi:ABC-type phosphate transport system substrate-binding protein
MQAREEVRAMSGIRWLIALLAIIAWCSAACAQDVVLVANKNVELSEIKAADLRAIFVGEKTRFEDGSHAVPVTLKGGPVLEVFLKKHIGESPEDFRAQWRKTVFTGQGAMPKACDSEAALIKYVAATPGAIGYVSRVSPEDQDKVKSLAAVK